MLPCEALQMAQQLLTEHNLTEWSVTFENYKRVFGRCVYRTKTIELSTPLVTRNELVEVRNTILHEIAHALTPGSGHGEAWKTMCEVIGARPERCFDPSTVEMPYNYYAVCKCGTSHGRMRRTNRRLECSKCHTALQWDAC